MFDLGATELLLIVIVAIVVIGPKDLPLALRTAGRWIGKMRRISGHFRSGLDTMIREAEMDEMEKKWKAQNEKVMREHPQGGPQEMEPTGAYPPRAAAPPAQSPASDAPPPASSAEGAMAEARAADSRSSSGDAGHQPGDAAPPAEGESPSARDPGDRAG